MPEITLKYSTGGLRINLPSTPNFLGVLEPRSKPALSDPTDAVRRSLRSSISSSPLREAARGRQDAVVVISDKTRPVPNNLLLPLILHEIEAAGVPREAITILVATGIHRPNEGEELRRLVGSDIAGMYHIANHFSKKDDEMVYAGTIMENAPAYVNRLYARADLKVLTGFIEPHMWAGYSGGRKSILPGISSVKTLQFMHGPEMIAHPDVVYGKLKGNPFHEAGIQIMEKVGADYIVNVTLNSAKEVTGVYSGHPVQAHYSGVHELEPYCTSLVDRKLDFVVTTNAGAPLDVSLYQTSKGIAGVAPVVKSGGEIVVASCCQEGLGSPEFVAACNEFTTPKEWTRRALAHEFFYPDQWCAQEIFKWMEDHPIHLFSDGITDEEQRRYGFSPTHNIEETVAELLDRHGRDAVWAVVPDGPLLIVRSRP